MSAIIKIKLIHPSAKMPQKQYASDAGYDLFATSGVCFNWRGQKEIINCGFAIEISPGYEAQIRSRSGLAVNHGIIVVNSPGTIDSGYRGIVKVGLIFFGDDEYFIKPGDRIAQMVINKLPEVEIECVDKLSDSDRGINGFGSTY